MTGPAAMTGAPGSGSTTAAPAPSPAATRPNLFVIGAPKCGTSALCRYLGEHPQAFFSDPKEPFFLCREWPHLRRQHFLETEADYLALFAGADPARHRVIGEGSTNYLRSAVAVAEALRLSPDAKFIAMLRSPVEIAHAFHMEQIFARNEDVKDFEAAWALQEARAAGRSIPPACRAPEFLQYREIARVGAQLARFFDQVPPERRLVLLQEDMRRDTRGAYERTLAFLGLPPDGRERFDPVNSSHSHRYEWLANLVLSPPRILQGPVWALRGWLRREKPPAVERLKTFLRVRSERSPLSPELRRRMLDEFEDDIRLTERLLGRDLSDWRTA